MALGNDTPETMAYCIVDDLIDGRSVRTEIQHTTGFSYSSDVLQIGDPFTITVPNPRGRYNDVLRCGALIQLYLRNPNVNGGQQTLKHLGRIVRQTRTLSGQGSVIQLDCADLGWHLQTCAAPLWYRVQGKPLYTVLFGNGGKDQGIIDSSFGIRGVRATNEVNRLLRAGAVNAGRAVANQEIEHTLGVLVYIQVEPGDKIIDVIMPYARRLNLLVNVSCDGYLQFFRPDYSRAAGLHIELHEFGTAAAARNNVLDVTITNDATQIPTQVTCVGEMVGGALAAEIDPTNQNATKRRGDFRYPGILPYLQREVFSDGDVFDSTVAAKQAKWRWERSLFDSFTATYTVRGHHQNGAWWESDTMCSLSDSMHGIEGVFYVASVRCDSTEGQGDRTVVTLKLPGLLQAAFGVFPRARVPKFSFGPVPAAGAPATAGTTTTVTK